MTVAELIAELECLPADAEVQIAYQRSWPLTANITEVIQNEDNQITLEAFADTGYYDN